MYVHIYFVEMPVDMTVEFHSLEARVEMVVGIHFVKMYVETTAGAYLKKCLCIDDIECLHVEIFVETLVAMIICVHL